jgi:hypothetical protein
VNRTIFISCGQFTEAEKRLGKQISQMVKSLTDLEPFFAEEVQDLNGLDANILAALGKCVAFITVLHPRGEIKRPDGSVVVRASVWIEQEIAIATYIQRTQNRQLPIIAFRHRSVGLEGIRSLLHLNPIEFADESEILVELPKRLEKWKSLKTSDIELRLTSKHLRHQDGHLIRSLEMTLGNETNSRIDQYEVEVLLPAGVLKHWSAIYSGEIKPCKVPGMRCFRFDQVGRSGIRPHSQLEPITFEYCTECARPAHETELIGAILVDEMMVSARAWVNDNEYVVEKTIKDLVLETNRNLA